MLMLALAAAHALQQFWLAYKTADLHDSESLEPVSASCRRSFDPSQLSKSCSESDGLRVSIAMCDDDAMALVIDNGSGMCKANFLDFAYLRIVLINVKKEERDVDLELNEEKALLDRSEQSKETEYLTKGTIFQFF
ncbi:unnamed protein product [Toxocara canis]|uniref:Peptidase A1 domain-containing protein n=1 Tax=Toxocara canis TaxID=6265 RepID=A0A183UW77_TOXCA|nr:unnamed protein product [Toxocara canis]